MASWTTPVTHSTGDVLAVTDWNGVANNTTFLYQRPYAAYYNSVTTSCSNSGNTQVTLGGTTASGYGFSVSSNNIIAPLTGIYSVGFLVEMSSGAGSGVNFIQANIVHNGSGVLGGCIVPSYTGAPASSGAGLLSCNAGDTISLYLNNQSGSTLSTATGANNTFLHVYFVGSQ